MAIQKTEAFILRTQPFRTSSLVVTTFSRSFGKIKGVAKGVRKEGVIRPGTFEPFNLVEIVFYEKIRSEIHLISDVYLVESFEGLRRDLETLATAYYLVELVDQLTESHDPHEAIFELLHFGFRFLPSLPVSFLTRFFEIRLLHEIGFLPHLSSCVGCGQKNPEKAYFSTRQGALFCQRCRSRAQDVKALNPRVLKAMRAFLHQGITEMVGSSSLFDEETNKAVKALVERFLHERLERPLATRKFLHQVQSLKRGDPA